MENNKKIILVTGGAGFIGSHLIERLVADTNNQVISLDNYFTGKEENHIQGPSKGLLVAYGLFNQEELLGVMSLGRHHRDSSKITLDRFCIKEGLCVVGGASKLFKACVGWAKQTGYSKIISWSDNRWSDGNVYKVLGFKLEEELVPDYSYVNTKNPNKIRISKQSQSKKRTSCPAGKTEKEWCLERGLSRIWDCGKKRWVFEL